MRSTTKEIIIFVLLCLIAFAATAYLTYRANSFDDYYEARTEVEE